MEITSTPGQTGRVAGSHVCHHENSQAKQVETGDTLRSEGSKPIRTGGKNRAIQSIEATDRYWTDEVEDRFFAHLAASCNVKASAKAVDFTTSTVYAHRKQRPAFAERWQDALDHGYVRLEMALLEAANATLEGKPWDNERPIPPLTVEEILKVIKNHHASVKLGFAARRGNTALPLPLDAVKEDIKRKVRAILAARSDSEDTGKACSQETSEETGKARSDDE